MGPVVIETVAPEAAPASGNVSYLSVAQNAGRRRMRIVLHEFLSGRAGKSGSLGDPILTIEIHQPDKAGIPATAPGIGKLVSILRAQMPCEGRTKETVLPHSVLSALSSVASSSEAMNIHSRRRAASAGRKRGGADGSLSHKVSNC